MTSLTPHNQYILDGSRSDHSLGKSGGLANDPA